MPEPLVCAGCSLLCDDVAVADGRLAPDCPLGSDWYAACVAADDGVDATVGGEPAAVDAALGRAAELLRAGRRPLLYGFAGATIEDARAAVALADRLGAIVTTTGLGGPWPGAPAFPLRGSSSATLGEIRDRSELVVVWREDPETTHPRLLERLASKQRTLVAVDDRDTATARLADLRLDWPRERDGDAFAALHLLARGEAGHGPPAELRERVQPLWQRLDPVAHATFVYGAAVAGQSGGQRRALALQELVRELSHGRHVVTLSLADAPGIRGADDVLTWQTGYPGTVDLGAGHPELVSATAPVLEHERVDVALRVEDEPTPDGPALTGDVAVIALSSRPGRGTPAVWIRTAPAGVGAGGTMHRLDSVPLALRPPLPSAAPSAAELLGRLREAIAG